MGRRWLTRNGNCILKSNLPIGVQNMTLKSNLPIGVQNMTLKSIVTILFLSLVLWQWTSENKTSLVLCSSSRAIKPILNRRSHLLRTLQNSTFCGDLYSVVLLFFFLLVLLSLFAITEYLNHSPVKNSAWLEEIPAPIRVSARIIVF